ncbi:MAG: hypothetical protein ACK5GZ_16550 [Cyanobium sp.]
MTTAMPFSSPAMPSASMDLHAQRSHCLIAKPVSKSTSGGDVKTTAMRLTPGTHVGVGINLRRIRALLAGS